VLEAPGGGVAQKLGEALAVLAELVVDTPPSDKENSRTF
jgi:hypothetical protein